jgi:orotate phosphoribosyltransferase
MDDLTTDGGSKLGFARGLRSAGASVEHVLTIFYHDVFPGAGERLQEAGLTLHALATWADILRADASQQLAPEDRAEVERFLADPVAWSTRHGGRVSLSQRT